MICVRYVKLYSRPGPKRREATHVHSRASAKHTRPARASLANTGWTCERHLDTPNTLNAGTRMCEINTHPTCGTHPTPPIPPYVNVHEHAHIECNRRVK